MHVIWTKPTKKDSFSLSIKIKTVFCKAEVDSQI